MWILHPGVPFSERPLGLVFHPLWGGGQGGLGGGGRKLQAWQGCGFWCQRLCEPLPGVKQLMQCKERLVIDAVSM